MSKYFFSLLVLCLPLGLLAQVAADTSGRDTATLTLKPAFKTGQQLRFSCDVARFVANALYDNRKSYEFTADYYIGKEVYVVAESGWGSADLDYDNLKYSTDNIFIKAGVDKAMFPRQRANDWSFAFFGLRYGYAPINRSAAWYKTDDGLGGVTEGSIAPATLSAHWFELTGGMRLELIPHLFAGWNIRGRFLLNAGSFTDLRPAFIAGYGAGDKNTAFDFNFYIAYALRWGKVK
jgi:hypothetical protein